MRFTVPGEPMPKERPRFNRKTQTFYTPRNTQAYEEAVAYSAMAQREKIAFEPVVFRAWVYTDNRKADLDNIQKSLWDGLNGHAFTDDKQICESHLWRIFSKNPRVIIEVEATEETTEEAPGATTPG